MNDQSPDRRALERLADALFEQACERVPRDRPPRLETIEMTYLGFIIYLEPWGTTPETYAVAVYDDNQDYDHGQINPSLPYKEAVQEARTYCGGIRNDPDWYDEVIQ